MKDIAKQLKKIEIVIESFQVAEVISLFRKHNIVGYTIIRDVVGCGVHGDKSAQPSNEILNNSYLMVACTAEQAQAFCRDIGPLIKEFGGITLVSDVWWLKR